MNDRLAQIPPLTADEYDLLRSTVSAAGIFVGTVTRRQLTSDLGPVWTALVDKVCLGATVCDASQPEASYASVTEIASSAPEVQELVARIMTEDELCPVCRYIPKRANHPDFATPIKMPGTPHKGDCPTIPRLSPEQQADLRERLKELDDARRAAWRDARNYIIGGSDV